jgi:large subunit ribosomal protein L13e
MVLLAGGVPTCLERRTTSNCAQAAGIPAKSARGIGIAVDHRRRNRCEESLKANAARLKEYSAALVVFPRKGSKPKEGEGSKADLEGAQQARPLLRAALSMPCCHALW